ncbi:acetoacetate decarboxylase family protein [uncultured Cloacibacillus sp.]|uniref:acetoacetate decarboxylase family protein n=1 Tax=uncultured Cloacibacillus sp. TaxID=889794 RepID=UPI0032081D49
MNDRIQRPFTIRELGNNVPVQNPLIPTPFVPYQCKNCRHVNVFARTEPELVQKYLAPTPFEYVDNTILLYISDFKNTNSSDGCSHGFWDAGLVVAGRYGDTIGGVFLFEYEDVDWSIAAGRELWGYPKKYADISMSESIEKVVCSAVKDGIEIIHLELDLLHEAKQKQPDTKFSPHLLLHTFPNDIGPGILYQRVIGRDTTPDYITKSFQVCNASMVLKNCGVDPLDEFASAEVICGTFQKGDYYATEKNGWSFYLGTTVPAPKE